ncbi:MAG: hypothetical protein ACU0CO_10225 [Shimia sp.]
MSERMTTARDAWGEVPEWVAALVMECDRTSQNAAAEKLGRSSSVVSAVIRNRYGAGTDAIEDRVRAVFMSGMIDCPLLGEITTADCLGWRDKAGELKSTFRLTVRMFRACNRCPRHTKDDEGDDGARPDTTGAVT